MMNVWVTIIALLVAFAMHGCSTFKGQSAGQVFAHLVNDGKYVILTGCKDQPVVKSVVGDVLPYIPAGVTKDAFAAGVQIAEADVAKVCNLVGQ